MRHQEEQGHLQPNTWSEQLSSHLLMVCAHLPSQGQGSRAGAGIRFLSCLSWWQPGGPACGRWSLRNRLEWPNRGPSSLETARLLESWRPQPWLQVAPPGVETLGKKENPSVSGTPSFLIS